jgi:hypothetical protein
MEIQNGAFATKEVFWVSGSCFTTEADEVVEIKGLEPRLMSSRVLLCCPTYLAKPDRASASQSAVAPHDDHRFCHPAFAVARQVVHHFASVGRMADMHGTLEVEMFGQPRQVIGVMIHIMAAAGLGGAPMAAPVVGDHAEALAEEEQTWRLLRLGTLWSVEPRVVGSTRHRS